MATKGYWELLMSNPFFRRLYLARQISLLGDWFALLAILALLRSIGAESASSFGFALVLKNLPSLFVTPWAGVCADSYDRKKIMVITDLIRFFLTLCFFLVLIWPKSWIVYFIIVLQSIASTFFEPAQQAFLPSIVAKEDLSTANALGAVTWSIMLSFGALVGGICTEYLGWRYTLAIDGGSYLVSMFFLLRINSSSTRTSEKLARTDILEALNYIGSNLHCWTLVCAKGGWNLVGGVTLMLTLLGEQSPYGFLGVSILYCSRGVGTAIGPLVARYLSQNEPIRMEKLIFWGYLCGAIFYTPMFLFSELYFFSILIVLAHLGGATVWVFSTVRLQQTIPEHILGRVFAIEFAVWTIMFVSSTAFYSFVVDFLSWKPRDVLSLMGCTLLLPAIGWWIRNKKIHSFEEKEKILSFSDKLD